MHSERLKHNPQVQTAHPKPPTDTGSMPERGLPCRNAFNPWFLQGTLRRMPGTPPAPKPILTQTLILQGSTGLQTNTTLFTAKLSTKGGLGFSCPGPTIHQVCVYVFASPHMCVHECVCIFVCVYACTYVYMYELVCLCVYICLYMYECVCWAKGAITMVGLLEAICVAPLPLSGSFWYK